jgi:hypothetical protein
MTSASSSPATPRQKRQSCTATLSLVARRLRARSGYKAAEASDWHHISKARCVPGCSARQRLTAASCAGRKRGSCLRDSPAGASESRPAERLARALADSPLARTLVEAGWGATLGYPALMLDAAPARSAARMELSTLAAARTESCSQAIAERRLATARSGPGLQPSATTQLGVRRDAALAARDAMADRSALRRRHQPRSRMSPRPVKNSPPALSSPTPGFHARVGARRPDQGAPGLSQRGSL